MTASKLALVVGIAAAALSWFAAKYHYSQAITKEVIVEKNHTITKIVTIKVPSGVTTTTETIDSHTDARQTETIKTPVNTAKTNISLLVSDDYSSLPKPVYGLSVSKELFGPVTVGFFGFTDHRIGVSIGINF